MGRWANRLRDLVGPPPSRRSRRQLAWWTLAGLAMAYAAWKLSGRGRAERKRPGDDEPQ